MCESNKREHWEQKLRRFHTFCEHWECYALLTWTFVFTGFHSFKSLKSIDIFRSRSIKKLRTFKDRKSISSTFQALKSDSWNSRVFKGFQDAYEPWTFKITNFKKCTFLQIWAINEIWFFFSTKNFQWITLTLRCKTGELRTSNTLPTLPFLNRNVHSFTLALFRFRNSRCLPQCVCLTGRTLSFKSHTLLLATFSLLSSSACLRLYSWIYKKHSENETKP